MMAIVLICVWANVRGADAAALTGWKKTAYRYYQDDEYQKALNVLEKRRKDRFAKILTCFVHMQEYVYSQSKTQKQIWKGEYDALALSVGITDIEDLGRIATEADKPYSAKRAKKLLKKAFKNIHKNEDVPMLVHYLSVSDQEVNGFAIETLKDILRNRRKVVKDGGTLRSTDIRMMKNPRLLGQLVAIVGQQDVKGMPAAYPKGVKKATKCLVLIEEPSLDVLDDISGLTGVKVKQKVQKAINSRKKKFPKSNWYSATGKKRS